MDQRPSHAPPRREPIRQGGLWVLMALVVVAGVPFYLPPGTAEPFILGVPYWMAISVVASILFAAVTSWACLRRWHLVEHEEENGEPIRGAAGESEGGSPWKA